MRPASLLLLFVVAGPASAASFGRDVMAVLSKGGCNQVACHGNLNGKGGFKLSLRGENPTADFAALTRDGLGRRLNPHSPADSLLLQKVTAAVPHEGGKRFGVDSLEYHLLARWIADGLPADPKETPALVGLDAAPAETFAVEPTDAVRLKITARFADGRTRDVTRLAVYEPSNSLTAVSADGEARRQGFGETAVLVRYLDRQAVVRLAWVPARPDFAPATVPEVNYVDRHVFARLRSLRLVPSELSSDPVFLRRVHLDTIGLLPTPDEARAFLADPRPDRRARLIDRLTQRPEFAEFWALKWADLLRAEEKVLDRQGVQVLHRWLRQAFADNRPLNELARDLIAARGSTYSDPPSNFYRALRDPSARAEAVAQVFLGLRLQCARCHNHPFDRWTQDDYHRLAAFFPRVQYRIIDNRRKDRLDTHEFDGEQIVWMAREGEVKHPVTGDVLRPRFLGGHELPADEPDRLQALADWVARPDNTLFARAQVNRVWYHLVGRGLVEPNDDFRASNPPVNPPLLDELTRDFVAHGFDLRRLVRTILSSRTYQLSASANATNRDDETNFSRALVRGLPAEVLLDAMARATGASPRFNGYPAGTRAGQLAGVRAFRVQDQRPSEAERFLQLFGKPERSLTCECERSGDTTLGQAFQLLGDGALHRMLSEPDNRIGRLLAAGRSDAEILDELYLAALCRKPGEKEADALLSRVGRAADRRAAWEDVLWGLVNAKEFLLRQ